MSSTSILSRPTGPRDDLTTFEIDWVANTEIREDNGRGPKETYHFHLEYPGQRFYCLPEIGCPRRLVADRISVTCSTIRVDAWKNRQRDFPMYISGNPPHGNWRIGTFHAAAPANAKRS